MLRLRAVVEPLGQLIRGPFNEHSNRQDFTTTLTSGAGVDC
jgi:hypothetical protein